MTSLWLNQYDPCAVRFRDPTVSMLCQYSPCTVDFRNHTTRSLTCKWGLIPSKKCCWVCCTRLCDEQQYLNLHIWSPKRWVIIVQGYRVVSQKTCNISVQNCHCNTVIPRLTKIIRSGITFVRRNLLAISNINNPVGLVGLPYVMWSAHFFVTHIQT